MPAAREGSDDADHRGSRPDQHRQDPLRDRTDAGLPHRRDRPAAAAAGARGLRPDRRGARARAWWRWSPARSGSCPSGRNTGSAPSRRCRRGWAPISSRSTRSSSAPTPSAAMCSPTGCCTRAACTRPCFWAPRPCAAAIAALVPEAQFLRRERFCDLTYAGSKKISRMPARSAIVGFSVENLYAHRRTDAPPEGRRGGGDGGAFSPRTRNAQVAMYQNGDVDYLVATDAIGMGLNLDVEPRGVLGPVEVRRPADAAARAERAGADRRPRRALHEPTAPSA